MATITDFRCENEQGIVIKADPYGNNVALDCPKCGHPVLIVTIKNQRGADPEHPAICRGCGFAYWVDIDEAKMLLRLRSNKPV